jgi:hypothetical protein
VVLGVVLDWISRGSAWFADGVSRVPFLLNLPFGSWDDATAEIKLFFCAFFVRVSYWNTGQLRTLIINFVNKI